jgi:uridine kinase
VEDFTSIETIEALNRFITDGRIQQVIEAAEALHERTIKQIADNVRNRSDVRIVLIAGPSSSGKTTTSKRIESQLEADGVSTFALSLDNYFVNRERTPIDEDGQHDFESIYALDLELFNENLTDLLANRTVNLPRFNFKEGCRSDKCIPLKLQPRQLLVIEGLHGLNDELTYSIPNDSKYKIYASPAPTLKFSENGMAAIDNRLIRRMVRDNKFRGHCARSTIQRWPSVRRGEEKFIVPFRPMADFHFNSSLVYEMAVLKHHVLPLLSGIQESEPEYSEAKRLIDLIAPFKEFEADTMPPHSIIREFIGGSGFNY